MAKRFEVRAKQIIEYIFEMDGDSKSDIEDKLTVVKVDNDSVQYSPKVIKWGPPAYIEIKEKLEK